MSANTSDNKSFRWHLVCLIAIWLLSGCGPDSPATSTDPRLIRQRSTGSDFSRAVTWSPDSKKVAAGTGSGAPVHIYDVARGQQEASFGEYSIGVNGLAWSPDGRFLAGAILNPRYTLQIWDTATKSTLLLTDAGSGGLSLAWSPDSQLLAVASEGARSSKNPTPHGGIALYSVPSWAQVFTTSIPAIITGSSWSSDGKRLAFVADFLDAQNMDASRLMILDIAGNQTQQIGAIESGYSVQVEWAQNSDLIAHELNTSDVKPGKVIISDVSTQHVLQSLPFDNIVNGLSWSPTGERIAVVGLSQTMKVWEAKTGTVIDSYYLGSAAPGTNLAPSIAGVSWSPDGTLIAVLSSDGTLWVWKAPK